MTPTFFSADSFHYTKKQKKSVRGKFQLFLIFFLKRVELVHVHLDTGVRDLEVVFFKSNFS